MKIEALLVDRDLKKESCKLDQPKEYEWISGWAEINLFTGMTLFYGNEERSTFIITGFEIRRRKGDWLRLGHADIVFLSKISGPNISFDRSIKLWLEADYLFRGLADALDEENQIGVGILSYELVAAAVFALHASFVLKSKGILRIASLNKVLSSHDSFPYTEKNENGFFSTHIPYKEYKNIPGEFQVPLEKVRELLQLFKINLPKADEVRNLNEVERWIHSLPRLTPEQTKQIIDKL